MNVLLVDDHGLYLEGIKNILDDAENVDQIYVSCDGFQAIEIIRNNTVDVLVTDIRMPAMDGRVLCERVTDISPSTRILAVTQFDQYQQISQMLKAGVSGYITKNAWAEELLKAINEVYQGRTYLCEGVRNTIVRNQFQNKVNKGHDFELTPRELLVLGLIADQLTTEEIADKLSNSIFTIESHRRNIMTKMNVHNVAGMMVFAAYYGVIDLTNHCKR